MTKKIELRCYIELPIMLFVPFSPLLPCIYLCICSTHKSHSHTQIPTIYSKFHTFNTPLRISACSWLPSASFLTLTLHYFILLRLLVLFQRVLFPAATFMFSHQRVPFNGLNAGVLSSPLLLWLMPLSLILLEPLFPLILSPLWSSIFW